MGLRIAWTLLVIVALSRDESQAQTLKGTIRDGAGAVLDKAAVVVVGWGSDEYHRAKPLVVQPDSQGRYNISLSPGVYDVFVSCPFCSPQVKQIEVKPGKDMQFNPQLKFSRFMKVIE